MKFKLSGLTHRQWLIFIIGLALILRLGVALYLGDTVDGAQQERAFDQHSYHALAQSLLEGRGYSFPEDWYPGFTPANTPTAHWSFLYPLYLAGVYSLLGVHPLAARLVQVLLVSILKTWLVYRLGKALFSETIGLIAAGLSAVYLYFIYYDATLMTEPFFMCAVLGMLLLGLHMTGLAKDAAGRIPTLRETKDTAGRIPALRQWALLGAMTGAAALLRQTILFWLPLQLAWMLWVMGRRPATPDANESGATAGKKPALQKPWVGALFSLAITGAFILPWTVRNALVYRAFLPLNSNAGFAFYSANHPAHGVCFDQDYAAPLPEDLLAQGLNEAQWNSALTQRGLGFILQDPLRYLQLTLSKAAVHFTFWPLSESTLFSNLMRILSFGVYLPFFVGGIILSWRERRRSGLIYLFFIFFNLLHILTWSGTRYRLPVDAALMPYAALALYNLPKIIFKHARRV